MKLRKPRFLLPALAALALSAGAALQPRVAKERGALSPDRGSSSPQRLHGREALPSAVVVSASLGIFRALGLNYLWLRSDAMQRQGRYFEAIALARAITTLEPHLSEVWIFQAWNLAYNVSAWSPHLARGDRFRWVLEGIRLLRDRGLRHNPSSPSLHAYLAALHLQKIGGDEDEAHRLYKTAFAKLLESAAERPRRRLLEEWRLEEEFLRELARRHLPDGVELDLRSSYSHALYWAEQGLALAAADDVSPLRRQAASQLRTYAASSLLMLLHRGRVVRQPGGSNYAFLPELAFLGAVERSLELEARREAEQHRKSGELRSGEAAHEHGGGAAAENLQRFRRSAIELLFLHGREREAGERLARHGEELAAAQGKTLQGLEELVLESLLAQGEITPAGALESIASLLRAALYLRLAGVEDLAGGAERLAALLHERARRREAGSGLLPLEDYRRSLAREVSERIGAHAGGAALLERLEEALPEGSLGAGAEPPEKLGLPPAAGLWLGLEVLDPLFDEPDP